MEMADNVQPYDEVHVHDPVERGLKEMKKRGGRRSRTDRRANPERAARADRKQMVEDGSDSSDNKLLPLTKKQKKGSKRERSSGNKSCKNLGNKMDRKRAKSMDCGISFSSQPSQVETIHDVGDLLSIRSIAPEFLEDEDHEILWESLLEERHMFLDSVLKFESCTDGQQVLPVMIEIYDKTCQLLERTRAVFEHSVYKRACRKQPENGITMYKYLVCVITSLHSAFLDVNASLKIITFQYTVKQQGYFQEFKPGYLYRQLCLHLRSCLYILNSVCSNMHTLMNNTMKRLGFDVPLPDSKIVQNVEQFLEAYLPEITNDPDDSELVFTRDFQMQTNTISYLGSSENKKIKKSPSSPSSSEHRMMKKSSKDKNNNHKEATSEKRQRRKLIKKEVTYEVLVTCKEEKDHNNNSDNYLKSEKDSDEKGNMDISIDDKKYAAEKCKMDSTVDHKKYAAEKCKMDTTVNDKKYAAEKCKMDTTVNDKKYAAEKCKMDTTVNDKKYAAEKCKMDTTVNDKKYAAEKCKMDTTVNDKKYAAEKCKMDTTVDDKKYAAEKCKMDTTVDDNKPDNEIKSDKFLCRCKTVTKLVNESKNRMFELLSEDTDEEKKDILNPALSFKMNSNSEEIPQSDGADDNMGNMYTLELVEAMTDEFKCEQDDNLCQKVESKKTDISFKCKQDDNVHKNVESKENDYSFRKCFTELCTDLFPKPEMKEEKDKVRIISDGEFKEQKFKNVLNSTPRADLKGDAEFSEARLSPKDNIDETNSPFVQPVSSFTVDSKSCPSGQELDCELNHFVHTFDTSAKTDHINNNDNTDTLQTVNMDNRSLNSSQMKTKSGVIDYPDINNSIEEDRLFRTWIRKELTISTSVDRGWHSDTNSPSSTDSSLPDIEGDERSTHANHAEDINTQVVGVDVKYKPKEEEDSLFLGLENSTCDISDQGKSLKKEVSDSYKNENPFCVKPDDVDRSLLCDSALKRGSSCQVHVNKITEKLASGLNELLKKEYTDGSEGYKNRELVGTSVENAVDSKRKEDSPESKSSISPPNRQSSRKAYTSSYKKRGFEERKKCYLILDPLYNLPESYDYRADITQDEISDYNKIIRYPMCMDTIASKLRQGVYSELRQVVSDFRRIFWNTHKYNKVGQYPICHLNYVESFFESKLSSVFAEYDFSDISGEPPHNQGLVDTVKEEEPDMNVKHQITKLRSLFG